MNFPVFCSLLRRICVLWEGTAALFENGSSQKMNTFLTRVDKKVKKHNADSGDIQIQYEYGSAYREGEKVKTITDLIALSNQRIYESFDDVAADSGFDRE